MKSTDDLKNSVLFSGLDEEDLVDVGNMAIPKSFKRGQVIFHQDEKAEGFYVLTAGRVKIYKLSLEGKEQILQFIAPGYPFAEAALFVGKTFPASAQAVEKSTAYFFHSDRFRGLIEKRPAIAINMIVTQAGYLRRHARTIEDLALREVSGRLAGYILEKAGSNDRLKLDVSKTQLAARLGTVSETLSRTLAKLRDQGLIEVKGRDIEILDRESLEGLLLGN